MKCQKLLITSLLVTGLSFAPLIVDSLHACGPNSQSDTGGSSSGKSDSKGNNDASNASNAGPAGGGDSQAAQNSDANGPIDNPCDYYWNYGSAKLHCPKPD